MSHKHPGKYQAVRTKAAGDDDSDEQNMNNSSNAGSYYSIEKHGGKHMCMAQVMMWLNKFGKILQVWWFHFGVSFLKTSLYLSVFYSSAQIDTLSSLTVALCFAFIDYTIHNIFNHQQLTFNLTHGLALACRKYFFAPLDSTRGKLDLYNNNNLTMLDRLPTFMIELANQGMLFLGSLIAASFNIKVVFPQRPDGENWKFMSHTRDGLTQVDIFFIALIGFTFYSVMMNHKYLRIKTNLSNNAHGVSTEKDCAVDFNLGSLYASTSFVSSFWLFVSLKTPNNLVVVFGAAMIADDYSNLGVLFAAEVVSWFVVEHAYYFIHRRIDYETRLTSSKNQNSNQTKSHGESRHLTQISHFKNGHKPNDYSTNALRL
jgi:hypothetical protein